MPHLLLALWSLASPCTYISSWDMGRMSSNHSSAQKSEWDFFLPRQVPEMVGFMVKDKTAATKFKTAMIVGSHPNSVWERKKPRVFVIYARYQDNWSLISTSATFFFSAKRLWGHRWGWVWAYCHIIIQSLLPFPFLESHLGRCLLCWMLHNQNPISYTVKTKVIKLPKQIWAIVLQCHWCGQNTFSINFQ